MVVLADEEEEAEVEDMMESISIDHVKSYSISDCSDRTKWSSVVVRFSGVVRRTEVNREARDGPMGILYLLLVGDASFIALLWRDGEYA